MVGVGFASSPGRETAAAGVRVRSTLCGYGKLGRKILNGEVKFTRSKVRVTCLRPDGRVECLRAV